MMKDKIAVVVSNDNEGISPYETIDAIAAAGFQHVFIQWYNKDWQPDQAQQLRYIREKGLSVDFAHLGYQSINSLWLKDDSGDALVARYQNDICICKENGIDMVVMHLTSKSEAPLFNEIGLQRLDQIVSYAQSCGVRIAFENTKIRGYLEYVLEHLKSENVGLCFDAGHYHAHFNDAWDLKLFENRIFCLHLHDNEGIKDQHLLPFDGTADWTHIMHQLKTSGYDGRITLEVCYRKEYLSMGAEAFYREAYARAKRLYELLEQA